MIFSNLKDWCATDRTTEVLVGGQWNNHSANFFLLVNLSNFSLQNFNELGRLELSLGRGIVVKEVKCLQSFLFCLTLANEVNLQRKWQCHQNAFLKSHQPTILVLSGFLSLNPLLINFFIEAAVPEEFLKNGINPLFWRTEV